MTRAVVQTAPRKLEMRELPIPEIDDDSALLRVEACGICGSDAEQYAHDLIETARKQYSEMLQKARDSESGLAAAEESAAGVTSGGSGLDYSTPIQEIEYVRTYTKVAQVQLRAVIDALAEQVDQLGQLPGFGTTPPEAPPSGEPKDTGA